MRRFRFVAPCMFSFLACLQGIAFTQVASQERSEISVGIVHDPCSGLPSPPDISGFLAARSVALKKGLPPPEPDSELIAAGEKYQAQMLQSDFAGLCRYAEENARLPAATDHRVVMFGDSITEGWSSLDSELFSNDIINRGVSGQTTSQMLIRFRADVLDLKPKIVHMLMGTNDIAGNTGPTSLKRIEDTITSMVELATAEHVTVFIGSLLPARRYSWRPGIDPTENIAKLNDWLKIYAHRHGLVYIDYYSAMEDGAHGLKKEFTEDGVHPNAAGYAVMKDLLLDKLRATGKKDSLSDR